MTALLGTNRNNNSIPAPSKHSTLNRSGGSVRDNSPLDKQTDQYLKKLVNQQFNSDSDDFDLNNIIKGSGVGLAYTRTSTWVFRPSPHDIPAGVRTPARPSIGPTPAVEEFLQRNGIRVEVNPSPVTLARRELLNSENGNHARNELADGKLFLNRPARMEVHYLDGVEQLNGRPVAGSRLIDVQASNLAGDLYESKLGRTPMSDRVRTEVAGDVAILNRHNGIPSQWTHPARTLGQVARPVGLVVDSYRVYDAYTQDGNAIGEQTKRTAAEVGGGWSGALAGAAAGGAAGAAAAGIGAVPGAIIGGILGGFGGEWLGGEAYDLLND